MCRITVFTPTYNRVNYLDKLYQSLNKQLFKDFEWLIIDDGSQDHTKEILEKWLKENNSYNIIYHQQKNAGKISALNKGLDLAKGELFFTVDSDDILTEDALLKIDNWVKELPKEVKFCGVMGNKGTARDITPNNIFNAKFIDTDFLAITSGKVKITGERAHVFFTEIHKQYKYPIFKGEKFMTEAVAKNRMAKDGYLIRAFNDIIYIYEYLEDGLTHNIKAAYINNPKGYALWLKEKSDFLNYSFIKRFKLYYSYFAAVHQKIGLSEIALNLKISNFFVLILFVLFKIKSIINNVMKSLSYK